MASGADAGASKGPTKTDGQAPTAAPKSVTITGTFTPTCTHASPPNTEYYCRFVLSTLTVSPPLPAGMTVGDAIGITVYNKTVPDTGWSTGLAVTAPAYPSSYFQTLDWTENGGPLGLIYVVFPHSTLSKTDNCGLITALHPTVGTTDFTHGFTANLKVHYKPTGETIDAKLMLTR